MFRPGEVFKVKVELSPEQVGFGRATVLSSDRKSILIKLKSARGDKQVLPRGTRLWFVGNRSENKFNGLWTSVVTDTKLHSGHPAVECKTPVFEAFKSTQRRRHKRAPLQVPIRLEGAKWADLEDAVVSRNLSRSGIGISVLQECPDRFIYGEEIAFTMQTATLDIPLRGCVINTRYNWLSNRTDVGLEFGNLSPQSIDALDKILMWLGSRPRKETGQALKQPEAGALAAWLKSERDDLRFLRTGSNTTTGEGDCLRADDENEPLEDVDADDFEDSIEREDSDNQR